MIIALLTILVAWLVVFIKRRSDIFRRKFKKDNRETEAEIDREFIAVEGKIQKDIQTTYKDKKLLNPKEKHQLEDKVKKDLRTSEDAIIETIEKDSKD